VSDKIYYLYCAHCTVRTDNTYDSKKDVVQCDMCEFKRNLHDAIAFHEKCIGFIVNEEQELKKQWKDSTEIPRKLGEIDSPPHYTSLTPEPGPVIDSWNLGWYVSNAIKYLVRAHSKGDQLNDLLKARQYLDMEIGKM